MKHALALYGADALDKHAHFARLLNKLDLDASDGEMEDEEGQVEALVDHTPWHSTSARSGNERGDADDEHGENDKAEGSSLEPLSLLRTIFPPFTNPPLSNVHSEYETDSVDPSVYMPWPSSSLLSTATEPPQDEDLLPLETDENALSAELVDDDTIDKLDRQQDAEGMEALWARIDVKSSQVPAGAAGQGQGAGDHPIAEEYPESSRTSGRPPLKRKRKDQDGSREKSLGGGNAESGAVENRDQDDADADAAETVAPKRARRKKGTAHISQRRLMYAEPDPDGRTKSSVYVLDSD